MAERRTARPGTGGRATTPRAGRAPGRPPARGSRQARPDAPRPGVRGPAPRPRVTGRAAVLVLVLAVLTVSYASSLRAYLDQREHIAELKESIAATEASIAALEREKSRWEDEAFVRAQARKRFGYLLPGETGYQVIGPDGQPLGASESLVDPSTVVPEDEPDAWWDSAWASVELAGDPPRERPAPATRIEAPPTPDDQDDE